MKRPNSLLVLALLCGASLLSGGCIWKRARVPTRHFILTLIPAPKPAPGVAQPPEIDVGSVKMPSYLLRESLAVRHNANEFEYLADAQWAERLDQCFRRTVAENLSSLLASNGVPDSFSEGAGPKVTVSVDVKQFDVDMQGRGVLVATWRVAPSGSHEPVKGHYSDLKRTGPSPQGNPEVIASTLSSLTAQFSKEVAQAIRDYPQARSLTDAEILQNDKAK
jgi:uncharacterized lipoprotein YmbA